MLPRLRLGPGPQEPRSLALYEHRVLHDLLRAFESALHVDLKEADLSALGSLHDAARRANPAGALVEVLAVHTLNITSHSAHLGALFRGADDGVLC